MNILHVLGLLQLLAGSALTARPVHDHWGGFGAYGPCSRTCGTGVAMRSRKCITVRTDGGHNCLGSSKSFQTCKTHECPAESRDFREEQCSQFDMMDFRGMRHTWLPYYGASNPCQLNCVPRGETFYYRHRPAVVDGTPCYRGRTDICVDGICRLQIHGEFMGLDEDSTPLHSAVPVVVALQPRETLTYIYKIGVYGECSATCNGGMQYRSVECWVQDPVNPHMVDESHCISQLLQRPVRQQACNMKPCPVEYRVFSFSECSVTCGEGQQTREVTCVGSGGERLAEHDCSGLARPPSVQTCRRPACLTRITWHVTDYGLCTRSCGGGVRERRVGCYDTDMTTYPEARCGTASKPVSLETCNSQPCPRAQMVPSVQYPMGQDSTSGRGFLPFGPGDPSAYMPQTNTASEPQPPATGAQCMQSFYGCCPDGHTSATGPRNQGCFHDDCVRTRYGCCLDGVTPAQGFGRVGCPELQTTDTNVRTPQLTQTDSPPTGYICSLPRDEGPCDTWKVRFYYNSVTSRCTEFWYGGCHGNRNNFESMAECKTQCGAVRMETRPGPRRETPRRGSARGVNRAAA